MKFSTPRQSKAQKQHDWKLFMNSYQCNYCGSINAFVKEKETYPCLLQADLKISGRTKNDCTSCGASVLERQIKFYFDELKLIQGRSNMRILHFNPEPHLIKYFANFKPELYILAKEDTSDRRYEAINIENIPYSNNSFDLIIANKNLESVKSLDKTLNELNRTLKPDGIAVLQTSFSHILKSTWEDEGIDSKELREKIYGDGLHRRLFGKDIVNKINQNLTSNILNFNQISESRNPYALDTKDPFMAFRKKMPICDPSEKYSPSINNKEIMVSILCMTYNHAEFISNAIESFINQETSFQYEIVIGEDCSTDDTLTILKNWAEKYPNKIKLLTGSPNLGVQSNWVRTYQACSGRYIAMCEGDDRWTDSLKLQKQFDYMEANPSCSLTFGNVQAHRENYIDYNYIGGAKIDLTSDILQHAPPINTLTVMFRNILGEMPLEIYATGALDMFIWSLLGNHGYGHYMPEILPSIYNQHAGGIHSLTGNVNQHRLRIKTFYAAYHYYTRIGRHELAKYFINGVVKDIEYINQVSEPRHAHALLLNMASEISTAINDTQPCYLTTLNNIIEQIFTKQEKTRDN